MGDKEQGPPRKSTGLQEKTQGIPRKEEKHVFPWMSPVMKQRVEVTANTIIHMPVEGLAHKGTELVAS